MTAGPLASVPVADEERLARFVFTERHIRKSDGTVKAEALAPFKHIEMSVTRHRDLPQEQVWALGAKVAEARKLPLIGRADFLAVKAREQSLDVKPDEPPPNHANVSGWPPDKPAQMIRALEIATSATYVANPANAA